MKQTFIILPHGVIVSLYGVMFQELAQLSHYNPNKIFFLTSKAMKIKRKVILEEKHCVLWSNHQICVKIRMVTVHAKHYFISEISHDRKL